MILDAIPSRPRIYRTLAIVISSVDDETPCSPPDHCANSRDFRMRRGRVA
jgi:hypothetical protein